MPLWWSSGSSRETSLLPLTSGSLMFRSLTTNWTSCAHRLSIKSSSRTAVILHSQRHGWSPVCLLSCLHEVIYWLWMQCATLLVIQRILNQRQHSLFRETLIEPVWRQFSQNSISIFLFLQQAIRHWIIVTSHPNTVTNSTPTLHFRRHTTVPYCYFLHTGRNLNRKA